MLIINAVASPANTPDGRVIFHLFSLGQDAPYEVSLTREAAVDAVPCLLWAIGNLPPDLIAEEPEGPAKGISVQGEVGIGVGASGAMIQISMHRIELGIPVSRPELVSLQAQIAAALEQMN